MHRQSNKTKLCGFPDALLHNEHVAVFPQLKIIPPATMLTVSFLSILPLIIIFKIFFCSLNLFQAAEPSASISVCLRTMTSQKK